MATADQMSQAMAEEMPSKDDGWEDGPAAVCPTSHVWLSILVELYKLFLPIIGNIIT